MTNKIKKRALKKKRCNDWYKYKTPRMSEEFDFYKEWVKR